jgi:hypothetical protein
VELCLGTWYYVFNTFKAKWFSIVRTQIWHLPSSNCVHQFISEASNKNSGLWQVNDNNSTVSKVDNGRGYDVGIHCPLLTGSGLTKRGSTASLNQLCPVFGHYSQLWSLQVLLLATYRFSKLYCFLLIFHFLLTWLLSLELIIRNIIFLVSSMCSRSLFLN